MSIRMLDRSETSAPSASMAGSKSLSNGVDEDIRLFVGRVANWHGLVVRTIGGGA